MKIYEPMERSRLSAKWSLVLLLLVSFALQGQDPALTNFHIAKNWLNPAYAGHSQDFSLSLNNRLQWVKISKFRQFNTYNLAANVGCDEHKLGFGFYAQDNVEGEGFLRTTSFGGQVARYWPFDYKANGTHRRTNNSIISVGAQFGFSQKRLDWERLVFSDQLSNATYQMVRSTSVVSPQNSATEFRWDLGAGARFLTEMGAQKRASLSMGGAVFHVLTNQESFFSDNSDIIWPIRITGHAFFNREFGSRRGARWDASLGAVYNRQAGVNNFTLMSYAAYESTIKLGVGYRGKDQGMPDAVIIQPTFWGKNLWGGHDWLATVSYEITSRSSVGQHRSSGTVEFGIILLFKNSSLCSNSDISCFYPSKEMKKYNTWGY